MQGTIARMGRPTRAHAAQTRQEQITPLMQALRNLNHSSRLSESPLCDLDCVRRRAATRRQRHYPRAHIIIAAVRSAHETAWAELGETGDAALAGDRRGGLAPTCAAVDYEATRAQWREHHEATPRAGALNAVACPRSGRAIAPVFCGIGVVPKPHPPARAG